MHALETGGVVVCCALRRGVRLLHKWAFTRSPVHVFVLAVPMLSQVRKPTNVVSTICDDRGDEPTYAGELTPWQQALLAARQACLGLAAHQLQGLPLPQTVGVLRKLPPTT
jgi:hypothetical protein